VPERDNEQKGWSQVGEGGRIADLGSTHALSKSVKVGDEASKKA